MDLNLGLITWLCILQTRIGSQAKVSLSKVYHVTHRWKALLMRIFENEAVEDIEEQR